jgi:hypothetical protein
MSKHFQYLCFYQPNDQNFIEKDASEFKDYLFLLDTLISVFLLLIFKNNVYSTISDSEAMIINRTAESSSDFSLEKFKPACGESSSASKFLRSQVNYSLSTLVMANYYTIDNLFVKCNFFKISYESKFDILMSPVVFYNYLVPVAISILCIENLKSSYRLITISKLEEMIVTLSITVTSVALLSFLPFIPLILWNGLIGVILNLAIFVFNRVFASLMCWIISSVRKISGNVSEPIVHFYACVRLASLILILPLVVPISDITVKKWLNIDTRYMSFDERCVIDFIGVRSADSRGFFILSLSGLIYAISLLFLSLCNVEPAADDDIKRRIGNLIMKKHSVESLNDVNENPRFEYVGISQVYKSFCTNMRRAASEHSEAIMHRQLEESLESLLNRHGKNTDTPNKMESVAHLRENKPTGTTVNNEGASIRQVSDTKEMESQEIAGALDGSSAANRYEDKCEKTEIEGILESALEEIRVVD